MSHPETYKLYRRDGSKIKLVEEKLPTTLAKNEVLIRIKAVSLNFRDVAMLSGRYPIESRPDGVPCSDAAAEVVRIGEDVKKFKVGDKVSPTINVAPKIPTAHGKQTVAQKGPEDLGSKADGVLSQYRILREDVLVKTPEHMSDDEVATLACAGTTAWKSLDMPNSIDSGKTVLLQGTGGVSMFSLLLCLAGGLRVIITSSSDEKLAAVKAMAPDRIQTINYKTHPDWSKEALRLTNGNGVDIVVENGGPATAGESMASLAKKGIVSLVGFLAGVNAKEEPGIVFAILLKQATMRGIKVGEREEFEPLIDFLRAKKVDLKPILDPKRFKFHEAPAAFEYLDSGKFVGKIIITVD